MLDKLKSMPRRELTKMLGSLHPLSSGLARLLERENTLTKKHVKKKGLILMPKMDVDEAHYLYTGLFKAYWLNSDGEEEIFFFFGENSIMVFPEEFLLGVKNQFYYLAAIEESVIYSISKAQMDEIYSQYPEAMVLTELIRANMIIRRNAHLSILRRKPCQRYGLFVKEFFAVYRRGLSDKDVMEFLAICQKTLTSSKREMVLKDRRKRR